MSRYLAIAAAIAFGAFGWTVPAGAGVIFDNGAPLVDPNASFNSIFSDFDFPQQIADDFTLAAGANTVTDVHWWGGYAFSHTPTADDFTIRIFADAGGAPAAPATAPAHQFAVGAVGRTATGDTLNGFAIFEYWTTIPALTLTPGTTFWLSIVNDTPVPPGSPPGTTNDDWGWSFSAIGTGNYFFRFLDGTSWAPITDPLSGELAFRLTNDTVPEPATLALFAAGLLALGWLRRRRPVRAA